ncbi:Beige/BEACH domain containing protein [Trichomonas vaginalis G3]|uniref:Beige/BEACH domain containing protein n=1 Tax=Trichomonas vaginalis (strain ATCC PRA-98 / G3) TaxID=412133 RepID=A2F4I8_TRIV3|nr:beige/BEACH-related family [Trichomonas vaginalis G3]EAY00197.1 Beige/BEACH domain containing protein [Trichomonas vaginalis G3]KAI5536149.1 beige/BEACH-related family [Trichomonas vaginalis G3]|eukprot:XP_001313126.1 Beige/BEACH domain containing protein [Trichomonas vaginalis G3]
MSEGGLKLIEPFQSIWIQYFTMDSQHKVGRPSSKTELDFCIERINYQPGNPSTIRKEVSLCDTSEEISHKLAAIFRFTEFPILNSCLLAQMCISVSNIKLSGKAIVPPYIVRSLIAFSYILPDALDCEVHGAKYPIFQDQCWETVPYLFEYIFYTSKEIQNDIITVLNPIQTAFSKFKQIYTLPKDHKIYTFLLKILEAFVPNLFAAAYEDNWFYFEFVVEIFNQWANCNNEILHSDPFVDIIRMFLQTSASYIQKLSKNNAFKMLIFISCFIGRFCTVYETPIPIDIKLCLNCIEITGILIPMSGMTDCAFIVRHVFCFLRWAMRSISLENELTEIFPIYTIEEPLISQLPDVYFSSHLLFTSFIVKKFKDESATLILQSLTSILSFLTDRDPECLDGFENLPEYEDSTYMSSMILVISALINNTHLPMSNSLENLTNMMLQSPHNPHKFEKVEGLQLKYQICVFNFCLHMATLSLNHRKMILRQLAKVLVPPFDFSCLTYIMPVLRSLSVIDKEIQFINPFLTSGVIENICPYIKLTEYSHQIDEFVAFVQLIAMMNPENVLSSIVMLPILTDLITVPKYEASLVPVFRCGFELSRTIQYSKAVPIIISLLIQTSAIFIGAVKNESLKHTATAIMDQFCRSIESHPLSFLRNFEDNSFFELSSKYIKKAKDTTAILTYLKTLSTFCIKYPQYIETLNARMTSIYLNITKACKRVQLTKEILNSILTLALNSVCSLENCTDLTIQNREAIKCLLNVVKDTDFEMDIIITVTELCKSSSSNSFECFHADVVKYALEKCNNERVLPLAINLYTAISSVFYSQVILNETFRSLYIGNDTRTCKQTMILNSLINMIVEGANSPVSSFFHLNGVTDCIIGPTLPCNFFNSPWSFATTIRMDKSTTSNAPLLTLIDNSWIFSLSFSEKSEMKLSFVKNGVVKASKCFKYNFRKQQWYYIIITYNEGNFTLYINKTRLQTIQTMKLNFDSSVLLQIGCNKKFHLAIDIGPTYFFSLDDVNLVYKEFTKSHNSYGQLRNCFVSLHPCLAQQGKISNASPYFDSNPLIFGTVVPYVTTILDVIEMDGIFLGFMPLFEVVNRHFIQQNDEEDNLLATLLILLRVLLVVSPEIQNNFESIGGFRLLSGFLSKIEPEYFTTQVASQLVELFQNLPDDSTRRQMVEFIWLNFNLWSEKSYEFQDFFFNNCLSVVYKSDMMGSFDFDSYDFLLFQCQTPLLISDTNNTTNIKKQSSFNNFTDSFIDNYFNSFPSNPNLISEQRNKIKQFQWNFYLEMFKKNPVQSSFLIIYMIIAFHKVNFIQMQAFYLLEKFIGERNKEALDSLSILNYYDAFIPLFASENYEIQLHSLLVIYMIANYQRNNLIKTEMTLEYAIHKAIGVWNHEKSSIKEFCEMLIFYANDARDIQNQLKIVFPEFITFLLYVVNLQKPSTIPEIMNNTEKILLSGFDINDTLFFYELFFYLNHCYEMTEENNSLFSKLIANSCNNIFKLRKMSTMIVSTVIATKINFIKLFVKAVECFAKEILYFKPDDENLSLITRQLCSAYFFMPHFISDLTKQRNLTEDEVTKLKAVFTNKNDDIFINQDFFFDYQPEIEAPFKSELGKHVTNIAFSIISSKTLSEVNMTSLFTLPSLEFLALVLAQYIVMTDDNLDVKEKLTAFCQIFESKKSETKSDILDMSISLLYNALKMKGNKEMMDKLSGFYKIPENYEKNFNDMKETISEQATQLMIDYKPTFVVTRKNISSVLDDIGFTPEKMTKLMNHDGFNSYINAHQKKRLLVEHHSLKLVSSFVNESTSNGGPLSSGFKEVHWRFLPMLDQKGRILFLAPNRNFDNHISASQLRDLQIIETKSDTSEEIPLKRILSENFSFTEVTRIEMNMQKAKYSYIATLLKTVNRFEGKVFLNNSNLVYDGIIKMDIFGEQNLSGRHKYIEIQYTDIEFVFLRKHMHVNNACEIYTSKNRSYFLIFASENRRNSFMNSLQKCYDKYLKKQSKKIPIHKVKSSTFSFNFFQTLRNISNGICQNLTPPEMIIRSRLVEEWQERRISNYTYLARLNILSGRSLNDISQYPVFPWVLNCYNKKVTQIDLTDQSIYRDFSVPIGAMNDERLDKLLDLYKDLDDKYQKCLFRSHFSNPASVIGYLIREEPFSSLHIKLQGGKYDHPDRLFHSIGSAWSSVTGQLNDFRELTPEFFCSHHFLLNENQFDLGKLMDGKIVSDVTLPDWSKTAWEFIELHAKALESEYVSNHLNEWIDLSFGVYRNSLEHKNVFHPFSYPEIVQTITDEMTLNLARNHCANFGVCPDILFSQPHPRRNHEIIPPPVHLSDLSVEKIECISHGHIMTNNQIIHVASGTFCNFTNQSNKIIFADILPKNNFLILIAQGTSYVTCLFYGNEQQKSVTLAHRGSVINCATNIDDEFLVTGGADCTLSVFSLDRLTMLGSIPAHEFPVVSVSGSVPIGLIISVDSGHNLFVSHLITLKFIHAFKIDCNQNSEHKVCLLEPGLIAVSCSDSNLSTKILFYDLTGRKLGQVQEAARVVKIFEILTNEGCYLGVTTTTKHLSIIDCCSLETVKTFDDIIIPDLVQSVGKGRKAVVCVRNNNKLAVLTF